MASPLPADYNPFDSDSEDAPLINLASTSGPSTTQPPNTATANSAGPLIGFGSDSYNNTLGSTATPAPMTTAPGKSTGAAGATPADAVLDVAERERRVAAAELELKVREESIADKERRLAEREKALGGLRPSNWPVCYPVTRHDIGGEIPVDGKSLVRLAYAALYLTTVCYTANAIVIAWSFSAKKVKVKGAALALSLLYAVAGPTLAATFWYFPLYNAVRLRSTSRLGLFFLAFAIQMVVILLFMLGLSASGCSGLLELATLFKKGGMGLGGAATIVVLLWAMDISLCGYVIFLAYGRYRGNSGSNGGSSGRGGSDVHGEQTESLLTV